jgi:hypothetical protein
MDTEQAPASMTGMVGNLPSWTRPTPPRQDPTLPGEAGTDLTPDPAAGPIPSRVGAGAQHEPPRPAPGKTATRTKTSSTGDPGKVDTAQLVAAGLGLAAAAVAWAVRAWRRQQLRRPTREQLHDIAEPIGRLLTRTWDATRVNADLLDVIDAGAATILYLEDGPLLTRDLVVETGVPADLQEVPA